jgi:hypothetical protein
MAINPNKQGSGYINIRNYLQANPNANLGKKIADQYGNELGSLDKSFQGAKDQFSTDLNKANVNTEENRAARESSLANPEAVVADPNKLTEFNKFLSPSFTAPNATNLETALGNTKSMTGDLVNPAYKTNLLQRYYGQTPQTAYSTGQKTLDSVFLNTPQSTNSLGESRRSALQQLGRQKSDLAGTQEQVRSAKGQTEQFGADTQSKLNTSIGDYVDETRGSLTNRLKNYQDKQTTMQTKLDTSLRTGQFDSQLAQQLGLIKGQNLYGLKVNQFYNPANLTLSNITNDSERARLGALSKLRGEVSPLDTTQNVIGESDIYGFDKNKINQYLTSKQEDINKQAGDQQVNLGTILGPESYQPSAAGKVTVKGPAKTSYYQYEDQMKPFFTVPNSLMTANQANSYMNNLSTTLNNIRNQWNQELQTSNPTEGKRSDVENFLKMWQGNLGKIGSDLANRKSQLEQTLYGNTRVNY